MHERKSYDLKYKFKKAIPMIQDLNQYPRPLAIIRRTFHRMRNTL